MLPLARIVSSLRSACCQVAQSVRRFGRLHYRRPLKAAPTTNSPTMRSANEPQSPARRRTEGKLAESTEKMTTTSVTRRTSSTRSTERTRSTRTKRPTSQSIKKRNPNSRPRQRAGEKLTMTRMKRILSLQVSLPLSRPIRNLLRLPGGKVKGFEPIEPRRLLI